MGRRERTSVAMAWFVDHLLRHRWAVVGGWLVALVAGTALTPAITARMTGDFSLPGEPGYEANAAIVRAYGGGMQPPLVAVVTLPSDGSVTPVELAGAFAAAGRALRTPIAWYGNTGDRGFVSADRRTTFGLVLVPGANWQERPDLSGALTAAMQPALPRGATMRVTGITPLAHGGSGQHESAGVVAVAAAGAVLALAVLVFVFGSLLALAPLLVAAVAIFATFLAVGAMSTFAEVSVFVEWLIALLGLGVAIDYALLIVTRWREELHRGRPADDAVRSALATAGRAVLLSGATVTVGLLSLAVLPVPFLRSLGYAGMLIPLISALVAVTLLPAVLAIAGRRLDWPRLRTESSASRGWSAWARAVVRRTGAAAALGIGALAVLAAFAPALKTGSPHSAALTGSGPAHEGLAGLRAAGIPSGVLTPIEVLLPAGADGDAAARWLEGQPGIWNAVAADGRRGAPPLAIALPVAEPSTGVGRETLAQIRSLAADELPGARVGGLGAQDADFGDAVYGRFPLMLALIAALTLILLTRAFRSLVLAAEAVLLALLSIAAALGTMVLIWQHGYGSSAIWDIPATGAVNTFIPVIVVAFLFGLSMDYEVFLLTRMREEYDRTGSTSGAVIEGIGRTGRLVTSAALILFLAFAALSASPGTETKEFASALGIGILLDATVVRMLLVPALVAGLGDRSWWLPALPARLLRVPDETPRHLRET